MRRRCPPKSVPCPQTLSGPCECSRSPAASNSPCRARSPASGCPDARRRHRGSRETPDSETRTPKATRRRDSRSRHASRSPTRTVRSPGSARRRPPDRRRRRACFRSTTAAYESALRARYRCWSARNPQLSNLYRSAGSMTCRYRMRKRQLKGRLRHPPDRRMFRTALRLLGDTAPSRRNRSIPQPRSSGGLRRWRRLARSDGSAASCRAGCRR